MGDVYPLTIFFDGACRVCSKEMDSYRQRNPSGRFLFVNIAAPDFCAEDYGMCINDFMKQMHVKNARGSFFTGVDAFIQIWNAFPPRSFFRVLGRVVAQPGCYFAARQGYALFARYRHLLPKRPSGCHDDSCQF